MRRELLERLSAVTDEEARILRGEGVQQADYTHASRFMIDAGRLLPPGEMITLRPHTRFTPFPRHTHNYIEIMYQITGETRHWVGSSERLTLRAGEIMMLNQHASHQIEKAEMQDVAVNIIVQPAMFDMILPQLGEDSLLGGFLLGGLTNRTDGIDCLLFRVSEVAAIQSLMESIIADLLSDRPLPRRLSQTALTLLFLHLMEHTDLLSESAAGAPPEHALVAAALREARDRYQAPSLARVAAQYGASVSYVSRLVRRATGKTFTDLVRDRKLERASELLRTTRLTISEVLPLIGYNNSSYFFHLFEQRFGQSPRAYRKAHAADAPVQPGR